MSFIGDVFEAARGGIQERDELIKSKDDQIEVLEKKVESVTNSRNYFKGERDAGLKLVEEAGERCAEMESRLAAAEAAARQFAEDFGFPVASEDPPPDDGVEPVEEAVATQGDEA